MLSAVLEDPTGYGRVVRDADGSVDKVVETKEPGDATAAELLISEVNTGIYVFSGRRTSPTRSMRSGAITRRASTTCRTCFRS